LFFYKTLSDLKIEKLEQNAAFWFVVGLLLYFSGALFIFTSNNFLKNKESGMLLWFMHGIFLTLLHLSTALALYLDKKKMV